MKRQATFMAALLLLLAVSLPEPGAADIVCPDASYVRVSFSRTFQGLYRPGQPYDVVTIVPNGAGETLASTGITIDVYLKNCNGRPLVGVPAQEVVIFDPQLCICPGGNIADAATDINGHTSFSGTIRAGGCAPYLDIYADGVLIGRTPVRTNSPDAVPASPCMVDASDLSALLAARGAVVGTSNYTICLDFNEDGYIDASDISYFASARGAECQ